VRENTSPDGLWVAKIQETYFPSKAENNIEIIFTFRANFYEAQEHVIEEYSTTNVKPGGHLFPFIFQWSKDGRYMYYSHSESGDGCFGFGNMNLMRLDLITGEIKEILNSKASEFALSPDEKFLAYTRDWNSILMIRDQNTLQDKSIESPAKTVGNVEGYITDIVWSNDGKYIAYTFIGYPCSFPLLTSIVLVDAKTLNQKILIDIGDVDYHVKRFLDSNILLLEGHQIGIPGSLFLLNISTGEITPIQ
jgi:Tol biopolymer transport system component